MFFCNPGVPSRVVDQRWLYVMSSHQVFQKKSANEEQSNQNFESVANETVQDSVDKVANKVELTEYTSSQQTLKKVNGASPNISKQCSQEKIKPNHVGLSQYSQETINKIFEGASSQFSQDLIHEPPQCSSSQYSQGTISKIFEDYSFESFEEASCSPPVKRRCKSEMPKNDASIQISQAASEDASIQISQETLSKIFEDDSFEPSSHSKSSSGDSSMRVGVYDTNRDDSIDSCDSDEFGSNSSVPRLKWKTSSTVGKWLLFNDTEINPYDNLSAHDNAWEKIKSIVTDPSNIDIFSAKCSTKFSDRYTEYVSSSGVICCYTGDYRDKLSVKRAGDAIRNALFFTCCIYYKTDDATSAGEYQHLGNTAISMYMHTNGNKMYERGVDGKWTVVSF